MVAAVVVFRMYLEGGRHGDKDVDRERVDIVDVDNAGLLRSKTNRQTNTRYTVIVTKAIEANAR